jgi:hypothetical protein
MDCIRTKRDHWSNSKVNCYFNCIWIKEDWCSWDLMWQFSTHLWYVYVWYEAASCTDGETNFSTSASWMSSALLSRLQYTGLYWHLRENSNSVASSNNMVERVVRQLRILYKQHYRKSTEIFVQNGTLNKLKRAIIVTFCAPQKCRQKTNGTLSLTNGNSWTWKQEKNLTGESLLEYV